MNKKILIIIIILSIIGLFFGRQFFNKSKVDSNDISKVQAKPVKLDRIEKIEVLPGSTFGKLMTEFSDLDAPTVNGIYHASQDVHDLASIRVGRFIELVFDKDTDKFKELRYKIDSEDQLIVYRNPDYKELEFEVLEPDQIGSEINTSNNNIDTKTKKEIPIWLARVEAIPYETKVKTAGGVVKTSVYEAALENGIDERAIIELANVFQWTIDFAMDPRVGDEFKLVYEERYLDGEYVMPGRILAGKYVNSGTVLEHYYFEESEDNKGYFDANGNSVQKMFLKAPVEFRYISSGYTTGNRVVMEVGLSGPHRAIDYAASSGTPIRAVGDGTVAGAGWSGCYGNIVTIRHNGTYTTRYAHQSKMAVHVGQRVSQGDIIGYVGSTGCSTGPHVHYEMIKNGNKINPLNEVLPPGKAIKDENQERFHQEIGKYKKELGIN